MERLDRISQYFSEKERKRLESAREKCGLPEMTLDEIKQSCRENNGYETPELNDKLYLHFRGFRKIENLEPYYECKAIWLDSNGFNKIEGLSTLTQLRCLYLGKNLLEKIEGLEALSQLSILDLSNNRITHLDNLSCCSMLQTLNISRNALSSAESIAHLSTCKSIINVDVTNNHLKGDDVMSVFASMESLSALSINGNPVTQSSGFRKKSIVAIQKISYLDRPIDPIERHTAQAFVEGGADAERKARETWIENEKKKRSEEMVKFREWQEEQKQKRLTEGPRVTITDFTEEEVRQRREEAEQAAAAEKRMFDLGISRVAQKYWEMEGQTKHVRDPLAAAVAAIEQEEAAVASVRTTAASSEYESVEPDVTAENAFTNTAPVAPTADDVATSGDDSSAQSTLVMDTAAAEGSGATSSLVSVDDVSVDVPEQPQEQTQDEHVSEPTSTAVVDDDEDEKLEEEDVEEEEQDEGMPPETGTPVAAVEPVVDLLTEAQQQAIRDERVAESLRIFYSQQEEKKRKAHSQSQAGGRTLGDGLMYSKSTPTAQSSPSAVFPPPPPPDEGAGKISTWSNAVSTSSGASSSALRPIYWSEYMDLLLARLVREHAFEFTKIAAAMKDICEKNSVGTDASDGNAVEVYVDLRNARDRINGEECRVRWAQLDASHWTVPGPSSSSTDVIYKICVQPSVLGKGHGAQPSFDSMMAMAAASYPEYLRPPTSFPSVSDLDDDEDEDDDDEP